MTEQQTCEQRIAEHMADRAEHIGQLYGVIDTEQAATVDYEEIDAEQAQERLDELPLSVEAVRHVKILFGTGGPADWLDAELDSEGGIRVLMYHFADWGDHAARYVEQDSPLWRIAEWFVQPMAEQREGEWQ